jgi:uncharacterized LabA/DUF88 family protein
MSGARHPLPDQVAVFIDYQNVHLTARDLFLGRSSPAEDALVDPLAVAERIVGKRRDGGELASVYVYRGRPDPARQPVVAAANDAQAVVWESDPRVHLIRRDLSYRDWPRIPPKEKGIDVALAVDLTWRGMLSEYDVGIVFSRDRDLLPAIEMAFHVTSPQIEIASWKGAGALWLPAQVALRRYLPYCHFLDADDFEAVRDRRTYV